MVRTAAITLSFACSLLTADHLDAATTIDITLLCSGTAQNPEMDHERKRAPINPSEVTITLSEHAASIASVPSDLTISGRRYRTLQWGSLLIVFENTNAIGFVQRDTGRVTVTAKVHDNPGPVLFQFLCESVKTKF
jgi:hypothetical protein